MATANWVCNIFHSKTQRSLAVPCSPSALRLVCRFVGILRAESPSKMLRREQGKIRSSLFLVYRRGSSERQEKTLSSFLRFLSWSLCSSPHQSVSCRLSSTSLRLFARLSSVQTGSCSGSPSFISWETAIMEPRLWAPINPSQFALLPRALTNVPAVLRRLTSPADQSGGLLAV